MILDGDDGKTTLFKLVEGLAAQRERRRRAGAAGRIWDMRCAASTRVWLLSRSAEIRLPCGRRLKNTLKGTVFHRVRLLWQQPYCPRRLAIESAYAFTSMGASCVRGRGGAVRRPHPLRRRAARAFRTL
jgi:hypothetical protein